MEDIVKDVATISVTDDGDDYIADIALTDGWCVVVCENNMDSVTMRIKRVDLPKVGSRRTVDGRLVKINAVECDSAGHVTIVGDDGNRYPWS